MTFGAALSVLTLAALFLPAGGAQAATSLYVARGNPACSDTGPGSDTLNRSRADGSTGVGLANIRDRLAQAYGDNHRFETHSEITGGFRVFIDIPYQIETEDPK